MRLCRCWCRCRCVLVVTDTTYTTPHMRSMSLPGRPPSIDAGRLAGVPGLLAESVLAAASPAAHRTAPPHQKKARRRPARTANPQPASCTRASGSARHAERSAGDIWRVWKTIILYSACKSIRQKFGCMTRPPRICNGCMTTTKL